MNHVPDAGAEAVPGPRPESVELTTIVTVELITAFGLAHAGPRAPGTWTDQAKDYFGKISILAAEFLATYHQPMVVGDLLGEAVDYLLPKRCHLGRTLTTGSRNAYRRVVRSFVTWLLTTDRVASCPRPICADEREITSAPVYFDGSELAVMVADLVARDEVCDRRTLAAMTIALDTSARASDISSIMKTWFDPLTGIITLYRKNEVVSRLPVSPPTVAAVERYLAARTDGRDELFVLDDGSGPITGKAMSKHFTAVVKRNMVRHLGDRRGHKLTFQGLRRTFVRAASDAHFSNAELCAFTGWDPDYAHQVIAAYDVPDIDRLRRLQTVASPLLAVTG